MKNQIGLEQGGSAQLKDELNDLLTNDQLFYMNARSFHWNIKGRAFFELHSKFEKLYNDLLIKVDELAERILTLGKVPYHTSSSYLAQSNIKEATNINGYHGNCQFGTQQP